MDQLTQQLQSVLRAMWRWRWAGLGVAWAVALVGAAVLWRFPDHYEASARVYVDTQTVLKPLMAGIAVQPDIDQQVAMLARTLITRPNVEALMRSSDIDLGIRNSEQRDGAVEEVASRIRLTGGGRENIYDIAYRDANPERAKRVVQNLVSMFVETGLGGKRRDSEAARRFIDEQIRAYEAKLQEAGIPTAVHYPVPLNQQPAYKGLGSDAATPISEWAAQHVMSLPMGPDLSERDQQQVVDALAAAVA